MRFILLLLLIFTTRCLALNITDSSLKQQADNVLRYDLFCETDEPASVFIKYFFIENTDTITTYTNISTNKTLHQLTIIGLLPNTDYQYTIHAFNAKSLISNNNSTFTTKALPVHITPKINIIKTSEEKFTGYISTAKGLNTDTLYNGIFDNLGRLIWYDPFELGSNNGTCGGGSWTSQQHFLYANNCNTITEVALNGTKTLYLPNLNLSSVIHHEIIKNQQSQIAILTASSQIIDKTSVGGSDSSIVVGDNIIVMDSIGNIVWEWSAFDHFDPLQSIDFNDYWNSLFGNGAIDWMHANAITQTHDDHYLLSFAWTNQVVKINAQTGDVIWVLGDNGSFIMDSTDRFIFQHHISETPAGTYLLFDNGSLQREYSRVSEFELDTVTMSAKLVWQFDLLPEQSTSILGSAVRLPNDNTLIGAGVTGILLEVDPDGKVVWQADNEDGIFRVAHLPYLYPPLPDITLQIPDTICNVDTTINLQASPQYGYFQGVGIKDGFFNPKSAGTGTHTMEYTYGWEKVTQKVTVLPVPTPPTIIQDGNILSIENSNDSQTYQWFFNNEAIENATQDTYTAQETGKYHVQINNENNCFAISESITFIMTSQEDISVPQINLQLLPNPYQNTAKLNYFLPKASKVKIQVFDIQGKKLKDLLTLTNQIAGHYQVPLSNYNGVHIIQLKTDFSVNYIKAINTK